MICKDGVKRQASPGSRGETSTGQSCQLKGGLRPKNPERQRRKVMRSGLGRTCIPAAAPELRVAV